MYLNPSKRSWQRAALWCVNSVGVFILLCVFSASARANDIVIAQSLDLSGQSSLGKDFSNGVRTYFDAVNARGGVRGRKIRFIQLDDSGDASQTATNVVRLLKEENPDLLLAPTSTASFVAAAETLALKNSNVMLFGAPTGTRPLLNDGANVISIRATYRDEAQRLLRHIDMMNIKSVALVVGDDLEASFAAEAFRAEAKASNRSIAFEGTTAAWVARSAQNANIEAVVLAGDAISVASPLLHAKRTARAATLFGFSLVDHRTLLELTKNDAIGMIITQAMPSADKAVFPFQREHRQFMKQFRDEPPSLHTLEGYVVARVAVNTLQTIDGDVTANKVSAAFRSMRDLDLGALVVSTRDTAGARRYVNLSAVSRKGALLD